MRSLPALLLFTLLSSVATGQEAQPADLTEPAVAPIQTAEDLAYKAGPGPHEVWTTDFELQDPERDKTLPLRVLSPVPTKAEPGPYPLIIFSHGLGGSRDAFPDLTSHWCSHGYVVILPTHADSIQLRREQGEDLSHLRRDIRALKKDSDPMDRIADIRFILDHLDSIELRLPPSVVPTSPEAFTDRGPQRREPDSWPASIDRERIGMAGHSAGAFTTQMVFGVKLKGLLAMRSFADPRIDAAILVSGQGTNRRALTKDSWADIHKPMMVITGSKDTAAIGNETPETRQDPFRYAPPGDKYLLFIEGATHSSYTGQQNAMRLDREQPDADTLRMITGVTASGTLAFWDSYLRDAQPARDYLQSDRLPKLSDNQAWLDRK